jgi:hypothetical protein
MNTAFYLQADPELNHHFRRRWSEPAWTPAAIDRLADLELAVGHHRRAEELAHRADEMRRAGR